MGVITQTKKKRLFLIFKYFVTLERKYLGKLPIIFQE